MDGLFYYLFYTNMKTYKEREKERQNLISNAHLIRAFSKEQLEENKDYQEAVKNGEKLYNYLGALITKANYEKLKAWQDKSDAELDELFKNDEFFLDAVGYELANHEHCYEYFDALAFFWLEKNERNVRLFKEAEKAYFDWLDER